MADDGNGRPVTQNELGRVLTSVNARIDGQALAHDHDLMLLRAEIVQTAAVMGERTKELAATLKEVNGDRCAVHMARLGTVEATGAPTPLLSAHLETLTTDVSKLVTAVGLMNERGTAWGRVLADKSLGDSVGINGTPTFFVNGRQVPDILTYDRLRAITDSLAPLAPAAPARR